MAQMGAEIKLRTSGDSFFSLGWKTNLKWIWLYVCKTEVIVCVRAYYRAIATFALRKNWKWMSPCFFLFKWITKESRKMLKMKSSDKVLYLKLYESIKNHFSIKMTDELKHEYRLRHKKTVFHLSSLIYCS